MAETRSAELSRASRAMKGLQHAKWLLENGGSEGDQTLTIRQAILAIEAAETEFRMIMAAIAGKW